MKLQDPVKVTVGGHDFYVRPFSAFKAANISGEVIKVVVPIIGSLLPFFNGKDVSNIMDEDIAELTPSITQGFESLSGDKCEKLLRELLVRNDNIAVDYEGDTVRLTEDLSNELFCGEVQDMYILAFHVIKTNYSGFFKKLGAQSGSAAERLKKAIK